MNLPLPTTPANFLHLFVLEMSLSGLRPCTLDPLQVPITQNLSTALSIHTLTHSVHSRRSFSSPTHLVFSYISVNIASP